MSTPFHGIRPTRATKRVLLVLLTDLSRLSGYRIARAAGVRSGQVYVILGRLERAGWVEPAWEDAQPEFGRRCYRLTPDGRMRAYDVLGLGLMARVEEAS